MMKRGVLRVVLGLLALGMLVGCENPGADATVRAPYLQQPTASSVVVKWRTAEAEPSRVVFGTASDALNQQVQSNATVRDHELRLSALTANTTYHYQVVYADDRRSDASTFTTPPSVGTEQATRVWLLGDSGTGGELAELVRDNFYQINGDPTPDVWLMLGDNAYGKGTDEEYQSAVFNMYPETLASVGLWPTVGNHDAGTDNAAPYYAIFSLPTQAEAGGVASGTEAYYSFDHANIHFISLNSSNVDTAFGAPMHTWLEADLQANTQDWTVVFFHHPPYSKGSHDSDREGRLIAMRENFTGLFDAYGVDLVFSGHSHSYERSYPVAGHTGSSSTLTPQMITQPGDGRTDGDGGYVMAQNISNRGVVYTVAGSSGQVSFSGGLNHPVHVSNLRSLGSVILDFNGSRLDARFISPDTAVEDHYTIIKSTPEARRRLVPGL